MQIIAQQLVIALTNGMVFALIALGYTMVYGILELINFAHGDLFMLASFLALTLIGALGLQEAGAAMTVIGVVGIVLCCATFSAALNVSVDRLVYRPLRGAPKLAPLVSAIGGKTTVHESEQSLYKDGLYAERWTAAQCGITDVNSIVPEHWRE